MRAAGQIVEDPGLRNRKRVFRGRAEGGRALIHLMTSLEDPLIVAVPAGGVPVAVALAEAGGWQMDVAPVSKITLPWNPEAGYGAVAFDGTVRLNEELLPLLGLTPEEIRKGVETTLTKVRRRTDLFRGQSPFPVADERTWVIVDDGLASGFTMMVAIEALRKLGVIHLAVAVPTGHLAAVERLAQHADLVFCPNIRAGTPFAVADAYEQWRDIPEPEAVEIFRARKEKSGPSVAP